MKSIVCGFGAAILLLAHAAPSAGTESFRSGRIFGKAMPLEGSQTRWARCVGIEGDRLYVAGKGFLSIYGLGADPLRPKLLGTLDGLATARQVAVQDGIAYIVARADGLWIVDCRDPARPSLLGHYPSTANCTGVDVAGDVCFIGGSKSGIEFIDVSDRRRPQFIGCQRQEPVESQSVAYRDGLLYSGEWGGQCVTVWDVHDMKSPARISISRLSSNGDGVWVDGGWLYAATGFSILDKKPGAKPHDGQMGLEIHDVSNPKAPRRVSRVDFAYCPPCTYDMWTLRVSGDMAFCAQTKGGLYAVDVADKAMPRVVDRWTGWPHSRGLFVASVAIGDGVAYVACIGAGAFALEAKGAKRMALDRGRPPKNASVRPPVPSCPAGFRRWLPSDGSLVANVTGLAVKGDVCYAAAGTAGLFVLGLSDEGIREVRRVPLAECLDVSVAGNRLFAAAGLAGWIVYGLDTPDDPQEIARIPSPVARDVYAYGDGTRWAGLNATVFDIADLSAPKPLVRLVNQSRYNKFLSPDIIGDRWAAGNSALKHFGWADLSAPVVREMKIAGYKSRMGGICAFRDKAFISDGGGWAIVEPGSTKPPAMRRFPSGAGAIGLPRWNGGNLVSISGGDRTAAVWDFSDTENPRRVKSFALPCRADPACFWRDTLVFPACRHGVLLPELVRVAAGGAENVIAVDGEE